MKLSLFFLLILVVYNCSAYPVADPEADPDAEPDATAETDATVDPNAEPLKIPRPEPFKPTIRKPSKPKPTTDPLRTRTTTLSSSKEKSTSRPVWTDELIPNAKEIINSLDLNDLKGISNKNDASGNEDQYKESTSRPIWTDELIPNSENFSKAKPSNVISDFKENINSLDLSDLKEISNKNDASRNEDEYGADDLLGIKQLEPKDLVIDVVPKKGATYRSLRYAHRDVFGPTKKE
ncbi:circumsporozoite protein-like [Trichogramma pretiosum]|uniref:circumsporozoite protein-like n=1 Tax=Trichogramma pretiosum TaxID=7493 RepID=UPI000C71BA57|nr:circumsporozoite protein-like [Trichogramma pretiosum]